ncbi:hypothetical protein ACFL02_02905 [Planctomycetota bacterium]
MKDQNGEPLQQDLTRLEDELRELDQPQAPADLEGRLLAAIPGESIRVGAKPTRRHYYRTIGWAAALVIAMGALIYYHNRMPDSGVMSSQPFQIVSQTDIAEIIQKEVTSARLLASANILAQQPTGISFAQDTYRYLIESYPDTTAGQEAKKLLVKQDKEIQ